jgi:hypothetical protein
MCGLNELGWAVGGPDEVALLRRLRPGYPLDELPAEERRRVVLNWGKKIEASDTIMMAVIEDTVPRAPHTVASTLILA